MDIIATYWPFLLPLILLELVLLVVALVHIFRHDHYRFGNRVFWIIIVVLFQTIGPVLYLTVGRGED